MGFDFKGILGFHVNLFKNRPRPEFAIRTLIVEKNPVTGILEPYFPPLTRLYRIIVGVITLSVMVYKEYCLYSL